MKEKLKIYMGEEMIKNQRSPGTHNYLKEVKTLIVDRKLNIDNAGFVYLSGIEHGLWYSSNFDKAAICDCDPHIYSSEGVRLN